jgi:hypothetical protein
MVSWRGNRLTNSPTRDKQPHTTCKQYNALRHWDIFVTNALLESGEILAPVLSENDKQEQILSQKAIGQMSCIPILLLIKNLPSQMDS